MSNKKYEHWCDPYHEKPETHSEIEELAKQFYKDVEEWVLHDMEKVLAVACENETALRKNHMVRKCYRLLDNAEALVNEVLDANSVYALYACDYKYRREHWLAARGLCFKLNAQLNMITTKLAKKTNIRKYTRLAGDTYKIANKIKNNMVADDVKKKTHCKEYFPGEPEMEET